METQRADLNAALETLREAIPRLVNILGLSREIDLRSWNHMIDGKLLPRLSPDFPLIAAICGGGSSGKSTLFNSIVGDRLSPSGGSAGINRRILVTAPGEIFRRKEFVSTLFEPFGAQSKPLEDQQELTVPGCPLYLLNNAVPRNMVLMDTPDFDTGARGSYTNREVVQQALEAADLLIYIFTNANYNNQNNTDFIARMLTGIGMRKCFLVYRVYSSFSQKEVLDHAMTVAHNIYGGDAHRHVLGVYRTDDDNAVAAGERFMELRPVRKQDPPFDQALKALDPKKLRPELLDSILDDTLDQARAITEQARISQNELQLYLDALQAAQSHCVQEALSHFPMDMVLKRFAQIWMETDPAYIRAMRRTGEVVGLPVRAIGDTVRWVKGKFSEAGKPLPEPSGEFRDKVEGDLINAVSHLRNKAINPELSVSVSMTDPAARRMQELTETIRGFRSPGPGVCPYAEPAEAAGTYTFRVAAHPVVANAQQDLQYREWKSVLNAILSHKEILTTLSEAIEADLYQLAREFRAKLGFTGHIRQTLSAVLNVIPATVAVTYILSTGDALSAMGIKIKLTGMFGLHDLYALVALPATTGLNRADRRQVETMLGPIAQTWLNNKLVRVRELFESQITGQIIGSADNALKGSQQLMETIQTHIEFCKKTDIRS